MHPPPAPQPQPARGPSRGWWLLAGVSALASLLLFVSAVTNLMAARDAAVELARGSGLGLVREIRRELLRDPEGAQGIAQDLLQQLHDDGLRYLAWMAPPRRVLAQAGQALSTRDMQRPPRGGPRIERLAGGQRFLAVVPMGGPRHRRHRWRSSPRPPPRPGWMVIELEPVAARSMLRRAHRQVALSGGVALVLLFAVALSWRQSRRARLAEQQLASDQQLKKLGEVSAVLGHEIKNPLASLKGHAQLLLEQLDATHPGHDSAAQVVHEATRLEQLTHQILDYARSGRLDLQPTDLGALIAQAIDAAKAQPVQVHLPADLPQIRVDALRLGQVLINLLRNARQASSEARDVEVHIEHHEREILVEVRDRGGGFKPGELEHIFEPFVTGRIHGTGLGLALAQRIVEQHGGRIDARSREGGGAVFRIRLPV